MIHNPARVAHTIVGNRYISLIQVDGEYELVVFKCRIVSGKPKVGDEVSAQTFTNSDDALAVYRAKVNDLKYSYNF